MDYFEKFCQQQVLFAQKVEAIWGGENQSTNIKPENSHQNNFPPENAIDPTHSSNPVARESLLPEDSHRAEEKVIFPHPPENVPAFEYLRITSAASHQYHPNFLAYSNPYGLMASIVSQQEVNVVFPILHAHLPPPAVLVSLQEKINIWEQDPLALISAFIEKPEDEPTSKQTWLSQELQADILSLIQRESTEKEPKALAKLTHQDFKRSNGQMNHVGRARKQEGDSPTGCRMKTCSKCRSHGIIVQSKRNHKFDCPFEGCICSACESVEKIRDFNRKSRMKNARDNL